MFKNAVSARMLLLIEKLSELKEIKENFYLAGGTALALQFGHRQSDDLDLFSKEIFENEKYIHFILNLGGRIIQEDAGTIHVIIDEINVSFLHYPYPLIRPLIYELNINIASIEDIACMKVVAISQRAEKKDFFDIYEILRLYTPYQLRQMFLEKYKESRVNCYHILRSFFYFDEADKSPDPVVLNKTNWDEIKKFFIENESLFTKDLLC